MKRGLRGLLVLAVLCAMLVGVAAPASAWDPFGNVKCSGAAGSSAVCSANSGTNASDNPIAGTNGLIMSIVGIVTVIAGVAAVIIIILAGLRFVQSGGSPEDVAGARRSIIYATVGLIVIVISRFLIGLIIGSL